MHCRLMDERELEGSGAIWVGDMAHVEPGAYLRLKGRTRACGARAQRPPYPVAEGTGLVDPYLRRYLRERVGGQVDLTPAEFPPAICMSASVPPGWDTPEAVSVLQTRFAGRPFAVGQHAPIHTLSGSAGAFTVLSTEPDGIVLLEATTELTLGPAPAGGEDHRAPRPSDEVVAYDRIGGLAREVARFREVVEYPLVNPHPFLQAGVRPARGVILHGPPGTGKTLLARALCTETGVHLELIAGPQILSPYFGQNEQYLQEVFQRAQREAPAIVVIDELDALAGKRGSVGQSIENRIVAALLTLMDGLQPLDSVVVIGTTNRLNDIDPALRRPGRFDHEIRIGAPNAPGRAEILRIHTSGVPLAADTDLNQVAETTHGFVGADLSLLCREAGLAALRRHMGADSSPQDWAVLEPDPSLTVTAADFEAALQLVRPSAMREVVAQVPRGVTFDRIGGLAEVKRHIRETVLYPLRHPEAFRSVGLRAARGILLYGPPGTGKTMLAKAVANESGQNFIPVKGPELRSKWFGESEERIRDVFQRARDVAPCLIFFDELDALAGIRGHDPTHLSDSLVQQLLTELDGLSENLGVTVLGATNRPEMLDPALVRPGRFDLQILVPAPDEDARLAILRIHTERMPLAGDVDLSRLARQAEGLSGADLEELTRRAGLLCLRRRTPPFADQGDPVAQCDLAAALDEVLAVQRDVAPRRIGFREARA